MGVFGAFFWKWIYFQLAFKENYACYQTSGISPSRDDAAKAEAK